MRVDVVDMTVDVVAEEDEKIEITAVEVATIVVHQLVEVVMTVEVEGEMIVRLHVVLIGGEMTNVQILQGESHMDIHVKMIHRMVINIARHVVEDEDRHVVEDAVDVVDMMTAVVIVAEMMIIEVTGLVVVVVTVVVIVANLIPNHDLGEDAVMVVVDRGICCIFK